MASTDKKHQKKLREAEKTYNKWKRAYLSGRISKEELKDKLRPYKYELNELNLVKLKDGEKPPDRDEKEVKEKKDRPVPRGPVKYPPWKKRSQLTIEEIEDRIDMLSLESRPSETLQRLYEKRYGEELSSPEELVDFHLEGEEEYPTGEGELDDVPPVEEEEETEAPDEETEGEKKKPFWKGILKRKKGET